MRPGLYILLISVLVGQRLGAKNRPSTQRAPAATGAASSKTVEPPINAAAALSRAYEEKAREALERYLPLREFAISITVTPSNKPLTRAPYEPKTSATGTTMSLDPEELDPYVSRITADVLLTSRFMSARRRIEELLGKALALKPARGDRVNIAPLGIEIESDEWRKEKTDLKRELEILKSENSRLNQELAASKRGQERAPATSEEDNLMKRPWFLPSLVGGACFMLLIGLLVIGRGFFSVGRSMGNAISLVASSLERLGGAISTGAESSSGGGGGGIQSLEAKFTAEGGKPGGLATLPMEAIHAHLLKLRHEILDAMGDGTESIILRHLTQLLSRPDTTPLAVVTLEVLGRDMATELFSRLGIRSQEAIMDFLKKGIYAGSKIEMMLEAAEELKTKLLVESLERVKGRPSEKVAQRLIQLTEDELAQVALELESDYLPRLFLYLDSRKIAALIAGVRRLNPNKLPELYPMLPKLPEAAASDQYDDNIIVAMDTVIDRTKSDAQRPFLQLYQDVVELVDDDISEQIVRELSQDPRIEEYLRINVISIRTLFLLPDDTRKELIEGLSNRDIAALAAGSKPEEQEIILDSVTERRKPLVAEEFESLTSRGGKLLQTAYAHVRDMVVKRLKEMKNQGLLALAKSAPSSSGSNEQTNTNVESPPDNTEEAA